MALLKQQIEVSFIGKSLAIRLTKPSDGIAGAWQYYPICNIQSVTGQIYTDLGLINAATNQRRNNYPHVDKATIFIQMSKDYKTPIEFDLNNVSNQPTWLPTIAGIEQAKTDINTWISQCSSPGAGGGAGATEATLQALLTATQQQQDFEMKLVRDTGNADKVVCEVVEYDEGTDTYTYGYKDVGGAAYVVVGPLEYLDAEAVLNLLLAEMQSINGTDNAAHGISQKGQRALGTDGTNDQQIAVDSNGHLQVDILSGGGSVTEGTDGAAHGVSQLGIRALGSDGTNDQQLATDAAGQLQIDVLTSALPTGAATEATASTLLTEATFAAEDFATEATLSSLLTELQLKADLTETQPVSLATTVRTAALLVVNGVASTTVAAGARSVTFFNQGPTDATVAGGVLSAGESITFDAGSQGDTLGAITYTTIATGVLKIGTVV